MFAFFGGSNGIPGLTSDRLTPGGAIIAGALTAGDRTAVNEPTFHTLNGNTFLRDVPGNQVDGDDVLFVKQDAPLIGNNGTSAAVLQRTGVLNGHQYTAAELLLLDDTAATAPQLQIIKQGVVILELTTQKSVTGALAAVTDVNAKAVLTSIIAALTGIKVAADNTT